MKLHPVVEDGGSRLIQNVGVLYQATQCHTPVALDNIVTTMRTSNLV